MPPRKEPKETVVYPASKRKPPPFKPQRPSKAPRVASDELPGFSRPTTTTKKPTLATARQKSAAQDKDKGWMSKYTNTGGAGVGQHDSSGESSDNPRTSKPFRSAKAAWKPTRPRSPTPVSSQQSSLPSPNLLPSAIAPDPPPVPSQSDTIPTIPRPLLIRLLHEHFADKKTKIDKHAIQVLQKYFEVFVREAIARAALQKKEDAERSGAGAGEVDAGWLELEDLEKVAAGMMLDF